MVVPLPDGGVHVCFGPRCPHVISSRGDQQLVCTVSGFAFGSETVTEHDPTWTGRSTTSGDPDVIGGTPLGGWRPRKDAYGESRRAFEASLSITAEQAVWVETEREKKQRIARESVKRGALCVDEVRDRAQKRTRAPKRSGIDQEAAEKLSAEASSIIDKLTTPKSGSDALDPEQTTLEKGTRPDPRLQNIEFVKKISLRRYVDRCRSGEDRFDILRLHDIFVSANAFVKAQREQARQREKDALGPAARQKRHVFTGEMKARVIGLIISLWRACALSPYMSVASRGADSFRPFCAGVLYSFKRGLQLPSLGGLQIIPSLPKVTEQLPTLRSSDASLVARQLQSSSHRGSVHTTQGGRIPRGIRRGRPRCRRLPRCVCKRGESSITAGSICLKIIWATYSELVDPNDQYLGSCT